MMKALNHHEAHDLCQGYNTVHAQQARNLLIIAKDLEALYR
jgi:hypothetical protein